MKRNLLVIMIATLLALVLMTSCSPKAAAPTVAPNNSSATTAYPAKQEPTVQTVATAYPATAPTTAPAPTAAPATTDKLTDEQIVALIEKQLNGHHTMDFLLSKRFTADQWVTVLNGPEHNDVLFSPAELEQVVAYLIAHQK